MSEVADPFGRVQVAGVPFQPTTLRQAVDWVLRRASSAEEPAISVRLANSYCVALASVKDSYGALLRESGVNFPDGVPVAMAMNLIDCSRRARRVRGPSLFEQTLKGGVRARIRHYFIGSTPATLSRLEDAVKAADPAILIAGTYSPPFAPLDEDYLDDIVFRAREWEADIVWVGMGTPKQDFVAEAISTRADIMAIGVGAAFDFFAGTRREAPLWVQKSGFEWAYRLATEPRRLWRRYAFGNARFIFLVFVQLCLSVQSSRKRWK